MIRSRIAAVALAAMLVFVGTSSHVLGATDTRSYAYTWSEGKLTTVEFWNDSSRVALEYAQNSWPQGQFAAERAYVNAARIVLRDGIKITDVINTLGRKGTARVHGAEANGPNDHHDYPPHVHVFYLYVDGSGNWNETNTHAYTTAQGKFSELFVIPQICGGGASYRPAAGQWVDIKDETCSALWQERITTTGDYEIRRNASSATYTLRGKSVNGDLASVDVLVDGNLRWNVTTTAYDGKNLRLVAKETDYQSGVVTTETWQGDVASFKMLTSHTTTTVNGTPAPTGTPRPTGTATPAPTGTPKPTSTPNPGASTDNRTDVAAVNDDGYQDGTSFTGDANTVWVGDNKDTTASYAGLRFAGVDVPKGATIESARLRFYSTAANSQNIKVNIYGEAAGNCGGFSASSLPGSRSRTSAMVTYSPGAWAANTWYQVDLTAIVKQITARSDWQSGNALNLILKGASGSQGARRAIKGFSSNDGANAARLVITYK